MTQENVANLPQQARPKKLVEKLADKYGVDGDKLLGTLKATCFKTKDRAPSNEEMMALLVVADQYGLNPFTREIFAFPDKQNGIVPVVGVDGWSRIINSHEELNGIEFRYAETTSSLQGAQKCPDWCEVVIHRKDREHPTVIREYLDEVYKPAFKTRDGKIINGPWQSHTKRFLRHKTLIQGARLAFGFAGIYDEDEARGMIDITSQVQETPQRPSRADFENKAADMHTMLDEFGESMGEFSEHDLVQKAVEKISSCESKDRLEAFMEYNESFEVFQPRSEARQSIASAYNEARERLGHSAPDDTVIGEPEEGWEAWSDNLANMVSAAETKQGLDDLVDQHKHLFDALKGDAPALHTSVLNAINKRASEFSAQKK